MTLACQSTSSVSLRRQELTKATPGGATEADELWAGVTAPIFETQQMLWAIKNLRMFLHKKGTYKSKSFGGVLLYLSNSLTWGQLCDSVKGLGSMNS